MKKMKKLLAFVLVFAMTFSCFSGIAFAATGIKPEDGKTVEQPFAAGTGGSQNFRIPCLVTLDNGTLVAACDARWNHAADACGLDTIVSYSKDNGATWNYTFANYLGDNGNVFSYNSTAFIDPAIATDGKTVYMIADLYPAGIAINTTPNTHRPLTGSTGFDENDNLILAAATDSVNGLSASADRISQSFDYHLEKNPDKNAESYYLLKDKDGATVEGYVIDAFFNIKGEDVDTNIFCGDSPYYPWPADYLYMTKSADGGATWSEPTLLNLKKASEQTLLVGPGRGTYTSTGRIVFTCYEFTNGDKYSACIYSDDGGLTWERGESVSGWSSEAVVTEADGKLYMFTRHGNAYYVSDDMGETWSEQKSTGLSYNSNCQLTAITYSEKIDGKTAILFAGPSSTSSRSAGKIWVGLVQEDGTLDWAYDYSVNGSASYAYSCITEQKDGSIALLYESAGSAITFKNFAIEDIADGAAIGDIWLTKDGSIVTSVTMKSNENIVFDLNGLGAGAEVAAESDDTDALTVAYADGKVTITSGTVTGLKQVVVTVKAGNAEAKLNVNITDTENYEIVNLRMGDTKTITDNTGDYSGADLSSVDTNIAEVTVTGEGGKTTEAVADGQLATAAAVFDGAKIDLDDCLYTFTKNEGADTYVVSAETADGQTAYLSLETTGQRPNKSSAHDIEVIGEASGTVKFKDVAESRYLHFWFDNTSKLYYDRCGTTCAEADSFELYRKADSASGSLIPGYEKVTSVEDGGQYLIARKATDNNYYVMHPSLEGNNYNYVAKVVISEVEVTELAVQLASGAANFNAGLVKISDCLYTFNQNENGTYAVSAKTANGQTAYLNLNTGANLPNKDTGRSITVGSSEDKFTFFDGERYLFFWNTDVNKLHFDRNSTVVDNCKFDLYTPSQSAGSEIAGFEKVTDLSSITDGGKYLIATKATDGNYYLLYPTLGGSNYNHVAKVTDQTYVDPTVNGTTQIVIKGVNEGITSATVGSVTYYIVVKNDVKNVTLNVGDKLVVAGDIQKQDAGQDVITTERNTNSAPYVVNTQIVSGQKYLIGQASHIMINSASKVAGTPTGMDMLAVSYKTGEYSQYMWTVTAVDGGYTIQDENGKYLSFNGSNVALSETAQVLTIGNGASDGFGISYGGQYLNNYSRANNRVAGYGANDNDWYFYAPMDGIVITAQKAGTAEISVGGVTYKITVEVSCNHDNTELANAKAATCTEDGYTGDTVCKDCGETVATGEKIDALRHDFKNYVSNDNATCTEDGTKTAKCERCDVTDTIADEGSATGHLHTEIVNAKEATETEEGYTGDKVCKDCGAKLEKGTVIEKLPAKPEKADREKAQKYYDECVAYYQEKDYTGASWAAYKNAMAALKAVLAKDDATTAEIQAAVKAVYDAAHKLEKPPVAVETPETPATPDNTKKPATGDSANVLSFAVIMFACAMAVVILRKRFAK